MHCLVTISKSLVEINMGYVICDNYEPPKYMNALVKD